MQAGSIGKSLMNNNGNMKDKGRVAKMKTSVSVVAQPPPPATSTTRPLLFKENNNNNVPVLLREFQKTTTTDDDHEATHTIDSQSAGKFGIFGGMFVPETIVPCLHQLEAEFNKVLHDQAFQVYILNILYLSWCIYT